MNYCEKVDTFFHNNFVLPKFKRTFAKSITLNPTAMKAFDSIKILLLGIICLCTSTGAMAADDDIIEKPLVIISGRVTDKAGNPLAGVQLSNRFWPNAATTDADGSFSMEAPYWMETLTASCDGYRSSTIKVKDGKTALFKLAVKKPVYGFVDVVGGAVWPLVNEPKGSIEGGGIPQFGVMGGAYRTWGGYLKLMLGTSFGAKVAGNAPDWLRKYDCTPTITAGAIRKITDNLNIFAGTGVAVNYTSTSTYLVSEHYAANKHLIGIESGFSNAQAKQVWTIPVEAGVMWKFAPRFNLMAGVIYSLPPFKSSVSSSTLQKHPLSDGSYHIDHTTSFDSKNSGNFGAYLGIGLNF